ncbi:MAG: hypothetical protein ACREOQ_17975 [Gemmatimonadales bacterium]
MRGLRRSVLAFAVLAVACGGEDLTLPGPGDPATLSIISGNGQSGTVGEAVPQPLVVQLSDGAGHPIAGATVTFQFSDSLPDAAVDPVAPATDTLGQAAASVRLGTVPGDQAIEAQVVRPGQDLQVRFRLTAVAKPPAGGGAGGSGGGSAGPPPTGGGNDNPGGGGGGGGGGGNDGGGGGGSDGGDQGGGGSGHGHGHDKGEGHGKGHGNGD